MLCFKQFNIQARLHAIHCINASHTTLFRQVVVNVAEAFVMLSAPMMMAMVVAMPVIPVMLAALVTMTTVSFAVIVSSKATAARVSSVVLAEFMRIFRPVGTAILLVSVAATSLLVSLVVTLTMVTAVSVGVDAVAMVARSVWEI